jgi:hypothetical protein
MFLVISIATCFITGLTSDKVLKKICESEIHRSTIVFRSIFYARWF